MAKPLGNKYFNATGLEESKAILQSLAMMEATEAGADWDGGTRAGDRQPVSNKQIVKYLADGNSRSASPKHRDLRPNDDDRKRAVTMYADELVRHLKRVGMETKTGVVTVEKSTRAGIVGGLRKAAKFIAKTMYERLKAGKTNTGAPAEKVSGELNEDIAFGGGGGYAGWRYRKYGIAESVVYIASGQLANALQDGKIKIRFKSAGLAKAVKILNKG